MSFTNDDLKRAKEMFKGIEIAEKMNALLARLEAAEAILEDALADGTIHPEELLVSAWLRMKRKDVDCQTCEAMKNFDILEQHIRETEGK